MLSFIYACGLKRNELLNLRPGDIDSNRETLFIRQSKGNKNRYVSLPRELIDQLREYYKREKPKTYLFEGQKRGMKYSPTSLAEVLKSALKKAGIKKHHATWVTSLLCNAFIRNWHRYTSFTGAIRSQKFQNHRALHSCHE